jgi:predicted amidohydrolase YtcJ
LSDARVFVGTIRTMTGGIPSAVAAAIAIGGGRVLAVGAEPEVLRAAPEATVTRLGDGVVVPGFVDAHHHLSLAALYGGAVNCSAPSIDAMLGRLREAARRVPAGQWIVGTGYDHYAFAERRHPTRADLDAACPDHPVLLLHYSFHECVASSRALDLAGIGRGSRDPPAGRIVRGARGEPNGHLVETALSPVETLARRAVLETDGDGFLDRLEAHQQGLFAAGITRIGDTTVTPRLEEAYRRARAAGKLSVPVVMFPISESGYLLPADERLEGPPTGEGPEELRIGPVKIFFDGGDGCAVCVSPWSILRASFATIAAAISSRSTTPLRVAASRPLRFERDGRFHAGVRFYPSRAEASAVLGRAVDRGFAVALHATGNEAVADALDAIGSIRDRHRDRPPPRIEHAMLLDDALVARLAKLGIMTVTQPGFLGLLDPSAVPVVPGLRIFPLREMVEAGVLLGGSSDAPVLPANPLSEMRRACRRTNRIGQPIDPEQELRTEDALALYTVGAARALGCEDVVGSLEPGKRADLVVLTHDPIHDLARAEVRETVLGGRTVYARGV